MPPAPMPRSRRPAAKLESEASAASIRRGVLLNRSARSGSPYSPEPAGALRACCCRNSIWKLVANVRITPSGLPAECSRSAPAARSRLAGRSCATAPVAARNGRRRAMADAVPAQAGLRGDPPRDARQPHDPARRQSGRGAELSSPDKTEAWLVQQRWLVGKATRWSSRRPTSRAATAPRMNSYARNGSPLNIATQAVPPYNTIPTSKQAKAVERLTMTGPNALMHELTYSDPEDSPRRGPPASVDPATTTTSSSNTPATKATACRATTSAPHAPSAATSPPAWSTPMRPTTVRSGRGSSPRPGRGTAAGASRRRGRCSARERARRRAAAAGGGKALMPSPHRERAPWPRTRRSR